MAAQVAGHIQTFTDKIESRCLFRLEGFLRNLGRINATERYFCRTIAFGSRGLDPPVGEQQAVTEAGAVTADPYRLRDARQGLKMLQQIGLQDKGQQRGLPGGDLQPEGFRYAIGKIGGTPVGNGKAAGCNHNRVTAELSS